jgi:ribonuclease HI
MKSLKFDHELAEAILRGDKHSTWRIHDDKDVSVNDEVRLVDKVDPSRPETWRVFGVARIERVIEKRLGEVVPGDFEGHKQYSSTDEMLTTFRQYYGDEVTLATPIKFIHFGLLKGRLDGVANLTTNDITAVKVFADGGSRGNPGPSASGFVILDPATEQVLVDKGVYLGVTTNNQAEYLALKFALEESQHMGVRNIDAYLDSMLVVNQLKGTFKVRNRDLWPIHEAVKTLIASFEKVTITHIPRELNKLADAAVNRAMDEALGIEPPKN